MNSKPTKINNTHKQPAWHAFPSTEVLKTLSVNKDEGLSHAEAKKRLRQFGPNELPAAERRTLVSIFTRQFLSPLIYLLLIAAVIAFFIGEAHDSIVILVVVLLNALVGTLQEGRAEHSLEALKKLSKIKARILRTEQEQIIEASEIVPGDILILNAGDAVPADARIIECSAMTVNEAALTGESLPVGKSNVVQGADTPLADRQNMIFAGTHVLAGRGLAVVTTTGILSEVGKIAELTTTAQQPKTRLELRIHQFGQFLAYASLVLFGLVLAVGLLKGIPFSQIVMIGISQMVSVVPEGLPVAVTIALAVGVQRMARRKTVIRRLSAVETLGCTTVICTDKTGTLTRNEMVVTSIYLPANNKEILVTGVGYNPVGDFIADEQKFIASSDRTLQKLLEACILCNDAELKSPQNNNTPWGILGDPTEGALLTLAAKGGSTPAIIRKQHPRISEIPFNSNDKMMATEHSLDGQNIVYFKGAPDELLKICNSIYDDGQIKPIDQNLQQNISSATKKMADSALRLLAFGFASNTSLNDKKVFSSFAGKVTLLGIVGEYDPPRDEVKDAVRECIAAGIKPVMVTGDHKATSIAIATSLGIMQNNTTAIDGQELDRISDTDLSAQIENIRVFSRVHPEQKLRIVKAFQATGNVVAMTGDGVNDAPALVCADVGVAMGITGTEAAKEAAKIIITDDNFSTIVAAIAQGRLVYQNIQKLILFLIVTSIDEVIVLFLALILGYPLPLAAVQILWINLVTEGTLTINLIMEPLEGDEMTRPPIAVNQPLLDRPLLSRIPLMVLSSVVATFGWYLYRTHQGVSPALVQSETFTILAICQWFNVINCRSATNSALNWQVLKNPWLTGGIIVGNVLQIAVIYWPPLSQFFRTVPIEATQFFTIGAVASLVLWTEEIRKLIVRAILSRDG